ncbi:MAG TPA: response regulator [Kofleriaceae bacterium]|nr:response regulator [Kofleriaceae bacterium]
MKPDHFVIWWVVMKVQRVLVVDDDIDTTEALKFLLAQSGRDVRVAHRGDEAISIARELQPDLAILDLRLPDMCGTAVARELRRVAVQPLHVVALSGCTQSLRDEPQLFDRALLKPVDAATLFRAIY